MTKKELREIAHAIVWNVFEGKKTYQFPKGFFNTMTQNNVDLLASYIHFESAKLQKWLNKQREAEQIQLEADRYAFYYNTFPIGEA
jgi:hypothetical protein